MAYHYITPKNTKQPTFRSLTWTFCHVSWRASTHPGTQRWAKWSGHTFFWALDLWLRVAILFKVYSCCVWICFFSSPWQTLMQATFDPLCAIFIPSWHIFTVPGKRKFTIRPHDCARRPHTDGWRQWDPPLPPNPPAKQEEYVNQVELRGIDPIFLTLEKSSRTKDLLKNNEDVNCERKWSLTEMRMISQNVSHETSDKHFQKRQPHPNPFGMFGMFIRPPCRWCRHPLGWIWGMEDLQTTMEFVDALHISNSIDSSAIQFWAMTHKPSFDPFSFPGSPFIFKRHEFSGSQVWVGPLHGCLFELDIAFTIPPELWGRLIIHDDSHNLTRGLFRSIVYYRKTVAIRTKFSIHPNEFAK